MIKQTIKKIKILKKEREKTLDKLCAYRDMRIQACLAQYQELKRLIKKLCEINEDYIPSSHLARVVDGVMRRAIAVVARLPGCVRRILHICIGHRCIGPISGRLMKGGDGQIAVSEDQVIVAAEVISEPNDREALISILEQTEANIREEIVEVVADAGYASDDNYEYLKERGKMGYIPDKAQLRLPFAIYRAFLF